METFIAKLSQQEFGKLKIFTSSEKIEVAFFDFGQAKEQLKTIKVGKP